ncbi:MAG: hypothetical protein Q7J01_04290 [Syntrophales bacterium]|nr:hypothetical protein [Syntrophales bacterium]
MPITYDILNDGHYIHAIATAPVTSEEFIEYELTHASDARAAGPLSELFEVRHGACNDISIDDMKEILQKRKEGEKPPHSHRCAVVVSPHDAHAWDLAQFYRGMVTLHSEENVIVFATVDVARIWLGVRE